MWLQQLSEMENRLSNTPMPFWMIQVLTKVECMIYNDSRGGACPPEKFAIGTWSAGGCLQDSQRTFLDACFETDGGLYFVHLHDLCSHLPLRRLIVAILNR